MENSNGQASRISNLSSPTSKVGKRKGKAVSKETVNTAKLYLTVILGIAIPLFSLSLSTIAGKLAEQGTIPGYVLGLFALVLCGSVLWVSLAHLAWAIQDITRSNAQASLSLAVTIDLALVLGELTTVFAKDAVPEWVLLTLMASVCIFSMALNVYAFLRHPIKTTGKRKSK